MPLMDSWGSLNSACQLVQGLTLSIKIAQKPYIIGSLGRKALKYESFEGEGKTVEHGTPKETPIFSHIQEQDTFQGSHCQASVGVCVYGLWGQQQPFKLLHPTPMKFQTLALEPTASERSYIVYLADSYPHHSNRSNSYCRDPTFNLGRYLVRILWASVRDGVRTSL